MFYLLSNNKLFQGGELKSLEINCDFKNVLLMLLFYNSLVSRVNKREPFSTDI